MDLAANDAAAPQVRAIASLALSNLRERLRQTQAKDEADAAHRIAVMDDIERFLTRPDAPRKRTTPPPTPPGDPIGMPSQHP